jgi:hypothetical protein
MVNLEVTLMLRQYAVRLYHANQPTFDPFDTLRASGQDRRCLRLVQSRIIDSLQNPTVRSWTSFARALQLR